MHLQRPEASTAHIGRTDKNALHRNAGAAIRRSERCLCIRMFHWLRLYGFIQVGTGMHWIDGTKWLIKDRNKGDHTKSNVPLMEIPLEIIDKYKSHPYCLANNKLLPVNSNQRFNGYLKEVAAICGINKDLTTHTGRHSFATTILIENGCSLNAAGEMLGHESERTTKIYAKTTDVRIAMDMKEVRTNLAERIKELKSKGLQGKAIAN